MIAAPSPGYLRTGPAPVARVAVSAQTLDGTTMLADLLALGNGSQLLAQEQNDATLAVKYQLTAAAIDHTTWVEYVVTPLAATATGPPTKNTNLFINGWILAAHAAYATIADLKRVLQKPTPTADEQAAMQRDLDVAAREIDWDLNYTIDNPAPPIDTREYKLLADVNLDRAVELWNAHTRPYGALAVGPDAAPLISPRDTWYRQHLRLNPLRERYPIG